MIRSLQIVLHTPMLNLIVPGNISMLFEIIIPIAMFDVFNTFTPVEKIYRFDDDKQEQLADEYIKG